MNDYSVVRSDTWEIHLPLDWEEKDSTGSKELYFESRDGTKGIYIAAWNVPATPERSSKEVAQSFRRAEQASLRSMPGYAWDVFLDESITLGGVTVAITDAWDAAQAYRIASKVVCDLPVVVRAAFHDYLCQDLKTSEQYFAPVIDSLQALA